MKTTTFLADLAGRNVTVAVVDGWLRFHAPPGALAPELVAELRARRVDILADLAPAAGTWQDVSPEEAERNLVERHGMTSNEWWFAPRAAEVGAVAPTHHTTDAAKRRREHGGRCVRSVLSPMWGRRGLRRELLLEGRRDHDLAPTVRLVLPPPTHQQARAGVVLQNRQPSRDLALAWGLRVVGRAATHVPVRGDRGSTSGLCVGTREGEWA